MPTPSQLQKIWLLSDTVLYPEAISFIRNLVEEQECDPLPASQVSGLLRFLHFRFRCDDTGSFISLCSSVQLCHRVLKAERRNSAKTKAVQYDK